MVSKLQWILNLNSVFKIHPTIDEKKVRFIRAVFFVERLI